MDVMYNLSKNTSQLRRAQGYSFRFVAENSGLNINTIMAIEWYQRKPHVYDIHIDTLCRLADFFQVTTDYLVGRETVGIAQFKQINSKEQP